MKTAPVSLYTSISNTQNQRSDRSNPAFGLVIPKKTAMILQKANRLAKENPKSRFAAKLNQVFDIIKSYNKGHRKQDEYALRMSLFDGLEGFAQAGVKLEHTNPETGEKTFALVECDTPNPNFDKRTILDDVVSLLTSKRGTSSLRKIKSGLELRNLIFDATNSLKTELPKPPRREITSIVPLNEVSNDNQDGAKILQFPPQAVAS